MDPQGNSHLNLEFQLSRRITVTASTFNPKPRRSRTTRPNQQPSNCVLGIRMNMLSRVWLYFGGYNPEP